VKRFADRFALEREIGSGGMSRVYLARDGVLDRPVAIKTLKPGYGETDIGARFRREGRTAARLSHPNIVQVYDAGEDELEGREVSYIVMEYLPGGDLKNLIDARGTLSGAELAALSGVAAGLAHAHGRGVIHRDIKPHNVLLDETGEPKLADFGIARALDATHATRTGSYLGTALYSAPEQLQGAKVTPESDIYSLGVTLYHAAAGEPPFVGAPIEVASQHLSREPTPPGELNEALDPSLERLILDCLEKDPGARPTADEVRLGLLEAGREAPATRDSDEPPERAGPGQAATGPALGTTAKRTAGAAPGDRRGPKRGLLAAMFVLALVVVAGALAVPSFLGGDEGGGQDRVQSGGGSPAGEEQGSGGGQASGQGPGAGNGSQGSAPEDGLTARAAERTIQDHYEVAASDDYQEAWNYLSSRYQDELGSRASWTDQFQTLESIEFTEGPDARIEGDTATVSFSTRAEHTNRVDTPSLTATLVNEDGEWKIDGLG
jgi:eukaryotic-like serine/threonine-protein kinase